VQPTNRSSRILLPVKQWFVYLSLFVALGLEYIPSGRTPGLPDWVALVLAFWCVREPLRIGMGVGLRASGARRAWRPLAVMGLALAYVVLAYLANSLARRVLWFPAWQQALHVLPLLLLGQGLMMVVRLLAGAEFPGWSYFLSSFSSALLWLPLSVLLLLPQLQPVERDDNRPI